ncbi:TlpA family protein disulfide reductase [Butyrivibrio sp. WCD3002]|uniref:TlpA family protein disulfide reductase n=1 Tax=Butyrivibrio sp. WCD3002 TaxID=1280676 RepID=UPI00041D240B|nr:TlpA disulfide reductase family protein [Butyrivibrio sp. WCD3002]
MWKKIKNTIVIVLATLGVLFIIIMMMPDDEDADYESADAETSVSVSDVDDTDSDSETDENEDEEDSELTAAENNSDSSAVQESENNTESSEASDTSQPASAASTTVNIPESEISDKQLSFKTVSLDNNVVDQSIFADYDITVVHVWGTFCSPCIAEMGDYASFYKELPENVNLVGIICDVYDGIDSNVSDANSILKDAGAEFMNLRISNDLYDITKSLQYVPSSFFVDRNGHVIGEMMDGAGFEQTKSRLESYLVK